MTGQEQRRPDRAAVRAKKRAGRGAGPRDALMATAAVMAFLAAAGPAPAQPERASEEATISSAIGERVLDLMDQEQAGAWPAVIAGYSDLLARDRLSDFERATLLKLRGRAFYEADRLGEAVTDWEAAIGLDVLPVEDANALRLNAGQLLLIEGDHVRGIDLMEAALERGAPMSADLAMRLAQAHGQTGALDAGLGYARTAFDLAAPPERPHFSILLYYYQQLDRPADQLDILGAMVERWPDEKANWTSYAALLAQTGRERDAFEVNRLMYVNGLLETSEEMVRLAQYYSYYEYPYGGATMLERELNSGRVEASAENFRLLANLWRQAREWDRARPVLRRVATLTGAGADYETLGEALYQSGEFAEAEAVFEQALNRGGLRRAGDTWALLGTVRVEQDDLAGARRAFGEALRWDYSRAGAQGWLDFIARQIQIRRAQQQFEYQTRIEGCELTIERMRRSVAVSEDELDSTGQRLFNLPAECRDDFDAYGRRILEEEKS